MILAVIEGNDEKYVHMAVTKNAIGNPILDSDMVDMRHDEGAQKKESTVHIKKRGKQNAIRKKKYPKQKKNILPCSK